jgi:sulfonate transport system ATP-binding protein
MISSGYTLKNVSKYYNIGDSRHTVLNDVSLDIDSNDITVILGASGCGKTTLLRVIAGLEDVSHGEIKFKKDNNERKPKVGFVFQESRLMYWLNVSENISFHSDKSNFNSHGFISKLIKPKGKLRNVDVDKYLDIMNLQKFKNSYPNELSGGMAQRVSIARALSFDPDILLMDEPFSSLDYFTRIDMQNEVIRIHESTNKGVIFVTHDIDEALKIGKKIVVFSKDKKLIEFNIGKGYDRDLTSEHFIVLKKDILSLLKG